MAFETYLRVRSGDGDTDAIVINRKVSAISGYIGSYVVDLDDDVDFFFDVLVGFQAQNEEALDSAVAQVRGLVGDENVREFRNRDEVTQTIG